ncbi:adenylosuccinate synthase [Ehrlichia canis]|uniref:Adenylosuccinate synthetase n=1 Tax=Ehrlichia canis (strain Jake) TaxID=269484 RepID=PURA_EHRCJ|nr:adenylosuccinate synthase [Ehrlichia canis]Q3YRQ6.1 RecName: Full=Adenylosuccinate synthetase; Short=AMPSase; Short=AdSS; AltName: Full=IMP--aspartate ligase [Ehrlichia canis str. Jake]AAZ68599.1 Adenylosuccinate synthetase [Ehrlichia canis str. Jake]AUO54665.1 adenylosuccinate synthetase [Ehrlichia canis]UKC53164.1 adenylosuccinate synthase [Ehrlichia canis]UKC54101.1 adenylosuccinate synthase [Ehrlichia canis]UKC55037.1 adenylosuccinate synthase [Ehrlichia canis]
MVNIIVVGLQWGDEGKGKVVDWLSTNADAVVRFQGGNNAGHTIVVNDNVYKLNLLPSSVLQNGKLSIIGNGVVLDPYALISEIENLKSNGINITSQNFAISESCPLVLSVHKQADMLFEQLRQDTIGTTNKGIGPCYADKISRRAIRVCDLFDPKDLLHNKVNHLLSYHNLLRKNINNPSIETENIVNELLSIAPKILPFVQPVWKTIHNLIEQNKTIIFEGAQGTFLDIDHGTYPFVTSSNTIAQQAFIGCGINPSNKTHILGLVKAYTTRVGNGPFFTEQNNNIGKTMFESGKELGTVSNRQRRCGWFDAVLARQAVILSGVSGLVMTKLDVLDQFSEIKICVKYKYENKIYDYLPASPYIQSKLEPVYETLPGWQTSTFGSVSYKDLPQNAISYIKKIEEILKVPIYLISTGPERNSMIIINNDFLYK